MSEVSTQYDIERLLGGLVSGDNGEDTVTTQVIQNYDFRRPRPIPEERLKTLITIHNKFSEIFGMYLTSQLQTAVSIQLQTIEHLPCADYVHSNSGCFFIFRIKGMKEPGVIELTPALINTLVERLLGGSGIDPVTQHQITPIEQRLMRPLIQRALRYLSRIWEPVQQFTFELSGFVSNPDFARVGKVGENFIVIPLGIKITEDVFLMKICYPSLAMEKLNHRKRGVYLTRNHRSRNMRDLRQRVTAQLERTKLEVRTLIGTTKMTLQELLELQKGDVLCLNTQIQGKIPIYIKNRLKFYGRPGILDGRMAVQITNFANDQNA